MKVTLTTQEIIAKFGLPADTELVIEQSKNDGWVSNIGHDVRNPPESLSADTRVEVKYRNGDLLTGFANVQSWKETDGHPLDIIAYRVI